MPDTYRHIFYTSGLDPIKIPLIGSQLGDIFLKRARLVDGEVPEGWRPEFIPSTDFKGMHELVAPFALGKEDYDSVQELGLGMLVSVQKNEREP